MVMPKPASGRAAYTAVNVIMTHEFNVLLLLGPLIVRVLEGARDYA